MLVCKLPLSSFCLLVGVFALTIAGRANADETDGQDLPETFNGATIELLKEFDSEITFEQVLFRDSSNSNKKKYPYVLFSTQSDGEYFLWSSNGSDKEAGTQLLKQSSGSSGNAATEYHGPEYKGRYYFVWKEDESNQVNLYTTDGTKENTKVLTELKSNSDSPMPTEYVLFKNKLYWMLGSELWKTEGGAANTQLVEDFQSLTSGKIDDLAAINNKYLLLSDKASGILIKSDGKQTSSSSGSTSIVLTSDAPNLSLRANDRNPTLNNDIVVFTASTGLFATDGTAENTKLIVKDLPVQEICGEEIQADGVKKAIFIDSSRKFVFVTDGTTEGTRPINITHAPTVEDANMEYALVSASSMIDPNTAIARAGDISFDDGDIDYSEYNYGLVSKFSGTLICDPHFSTARRGIFELTADGMSIWATDQGADGEDGHNDIGLELFHTFDDQWPMDFFTLPNGRFLMYTWRGFNQIWISDGSSTGTKLLADFPGPQAAGGQGFAVLSNNVVLVRGASTTQETKLYRLNIPKSVSPDTLASGAGADSRNLNMMMTWSIGISMGIMFSFW